LTAYILIDTNVLVYAVDPASGAKARAANVLVERLGDARSGLISPQVMAEFFAASTRTRGGKAPILTAGEAALWSEKWLALFEFVPLSAEVTREAIRLAPAHQMHIYDAQILAAAKRAGARFVVTEDGPSAGQIEGVRYVDPFARGFRPAHIGL
jgi:predicted nucleic acid-binding protein